MVWQLLCCRPENTAEGGENRPTQHRFLTPLRLSRASDVCAGHAASSRTAHTPATDCWPPSPLGGATGSSVPGPAGSGTASSRRCVTLLNSAFTYYHYTYAHTHFTAFLHFWLDAKLHFVVSVLVLCAMTIKCNLI